MLNPMLKWSSFLTPAVAAGLFVLMMHGDFSSFITN
jgi:hypothetical protein